MIYQENIKHLLDTEGEAKQQEQAPYSRNSRNIK